MLKLVDEHFPHIFPLLCGVDVSYETPPFSPILRVLPWWTNIKVAQQMSTQGETPMPSESLLNDSTVQQ